MNSINKLLYFLDHTGKNIPRTKAVNINFYHFTFVLEGTITYFANGKEYRLEKNDGLLLVPDTLRIRDTVPEKVRYVIINYQPVKGMEIKSNIFLKNAVNSQIHKLLDACPAKVYAPAASGGYTDHNNLKLGTTLHNLSNCILLELLDSMKQETNNVHVNNALKYINENVTSPLTLDDLCRAIHLSKSYTSRVFRKEMKMTVTEYINKQKLSIAKSMLADDELPLQEIASKLGYENYCYFSKIFKKEYGVSPIKMKNGIDMI